MIREAEVRRRAARWRVDPMMVDLDYSLSWFITARGLDVLELDLQDLLDRRSEFEADWNRRLSYLVHASGGSDFEDAWTTVTAPLRQVETNLAR